MASKKNSQKRIYPQLTVISEIPIKVTTALTHAINGGRLPVLIQSNGRIITGVVAESVLTTPASPSANPYKRSVMPTPIAKNPLNIIIPISFIVYGVFCLKRGLGMKPTHSRQSADMPTLIADAVTGSTPSAIMGRAIIEPTACPNAASKPNAIP